MSWVICTVRPRKIPKLNLTTKCLWELIAWNIPDCHELGFYMPANQGINVKNNRGSISSFEILYSHTEHRGV